MAQKAARSRHGASSTIVIKLGAFSDLSNLIVLNERAGTSSIVHEKTHHPLLSTLSSVVEVVVHLRAQGHKVVLVSSGAIGVGLQRMDMPARPKNLSGKQVSHYLQEDEAEPLYSRLGIGGNWSRKAHRALG